MRMPTLFQCSMARALNLAELMAVVKEDLMNTSAPQQYQFPAGFPTPDYGVQGGRPPAPLLAAYGVPVSVEAAQRLLARAKAEAKAEREAEAARKLEEQRRERLHYDRRLASSTSAMLAEIYSIEYTGCRAQMVEGFAEFRDALAPLAAAYGYKLVLVGDKNRAVLTK